MTNFKELFMIFQKAWYWIKNPIHTKLLLTFHDSFWMNYGSLVIFFINSIPEKTE